MRVGAAVYYTLSDHIGSTSITLNNSGSKTAEMRYKAWGEVRYDDGNLQTDRTYTGQRSYSDDFGLMFYNARWYDTAIGRFAQADTIVPDGIQGYDRYAYVDNNPIMKNDPSGHCPICLVGLAVIGIAAVVMIANQADLAVPAFVGSGPDVNGVEYVNNNVPKSTNILVAGGIAVQSQWYNPIVDDPHNPFASSYGPAQLGKKEYPEGTNPQNIDVAIAGMAKRINSSLTACGNQCAKDPTNAFIAAALAQNGPGGAFDRRDFPPGDLNWAKMFAARDPSTNPVPHLREELTGLQYDTSFMLRLYINDVKALIAMGWQLPPGYENLDWEKLEQLASPPSQSTQTP